MCVYRDIYIYIHISVYIYIYIHVLMGSSQNYGPLLVHDGGYQNGTLILKTTHIIEWLV